MASSQEAVRRLTIVTSAPGADQAAASLRGVAKAMDGVTVASTSQEKATLSLDQKFASIERRYVSQVRTQQDFEKIQKQVNAAVAQNPALQDRANVILAAAKERHDQLGNSQRALATVAQDLSSRAQALSGSFGVVGSALFALGPAGIAAGVVLGGLTLGFHQAAAAALQLAERAGKLKDFSETTGFTVVQLQALEKAGAQVGVSSESVTRGLERFSVAMDDVKKGTGPAFEAILEINPALALQLTRVNSLTEAWDIFARAIKTADLEQSNKLARSIFGRSGVEITRLARANVDAGGTAGVVAQLKEVDRITAAQAERWDELGDKISENMKAAKQNIASIFAEPVLNALNTFSAGFLGLSRIAKEFTVSEELKLLLTAIKIVGGPITLPISLAAKGVSAASSFINGAGGTAPANDNTLSFNDRYANSPTGQAVSMQTVQLEAQKRALAVSVAEQERWNVVIGAAVTPAENLRLGLDKLKLSYLENKIGAEQYARGQAALNLDATIARQNAHNSALGAAASVTDLVSAKTLELAKAQQQGAGLTQAQIENQKRLTAENALGITQIKASADSYRLEAEVIGMSEGAATTYVAIQTRINQARRDGQTLTQDNIAAITREAQAMGQAVQTATNLRFGYDTLQSATVSFGQNLRNGQGAWEAFKNSGLNALGSIADQLMKMATANLWQAAFGGSSGGGFGGLLSGIFGIGTGTVANGGIVLGGAAGPGVFAAANGGTFGPGWGVVGERGPELINVHSGGVTVIPHEVSRPHLPGFADGGTLSANGNVRRLPKGQDNAPVNNFTFAPVIDARGADAAAVAKIATVVAKQQRDFERNVQAVFGKMRANNPGASR